MIAGKPRFWKFATKVPAAARHERLGESKRPGSAAKPDQKGEVGFAPHLVGRVWRPTRPALDAKNRRYLAPAETLVANLQNPGYSGGHDHKIDI